VSAIQLSGCLGWIGLSSVHQIWCVEQVIAQNILHWGLSHVNLSVPVPSSCQLDLCSLVLSGGNNGTVGNQWLGKFLRVIRISNIWLFFLEVIVKGEMRFDFIRITIKSYLGPISLANVIWEAWKRGRQYSHKGV
jgi:hypothetical protein